MGEIREAGRGSVPARRHKLPGDRRRRLHDLGRRTAADLRDFGMGAINIGTCSRTPASAASSTPPNARPALRHPRHHRRRQVRRRRGHPAGDSEVAARTCASSWSTRTTNTAASSANRAGAQAAQRQAAVLAVQLRRDRRRLLRRRAGRRRGTRNPLRSHPAREGHLHPVPRGNANRLAAKRRDPKSTGFTVDTPVPYRLADLVA